MMSVTILLNKVILQVQDVHAPVGEKYHGGAQVKKKKNTKKIMNKLHIFTVITWRKKKHKTLKDLGL